ATQPDAEPGSGERIVHAPTVRTGGRRIVGRPDDSPSSRRTNQRRLRFFFGFGFALGFAFGFATVGAIAVSRPFITCQCGEHAYAYGPGARSISKVRSPTNSTSVWTRSRRPSGLFASTKLCSAERSCTT